MFGQFVRYFSKSAAHMAKKRKTKKFPSILAYGCHEGAGGYLIWRNLSFVMMLVVVGVAANVYLEHTREPHKRQKFIPYEHLRLHVKKYAWGDGVKTFFHNKRINPLPSGYEDDDEDEE